MKRLALDIDGTLAKTVETYIDEILDQTIEKENIENYDLSGVPANLEHFLKYSDQIWLQRPDLIKPCDMRPDQATAKLSEFYEIDIITARPTAPDTIKLWLDTHHITYKNFLHGIENKDELKYDLYIDDNPYLAKKLDDDSIIVYDQPWNQHIDKPRTSSLNKFADKLYKNIINDN